MGVGGQRSRGEKQAAPVRSLSICAADASRIRSSVRGGRRYGTPPGKNSEALFAALLADAVQSPDIRNTLDDAGVSVDELLADVRARREEILHDVGPELGAYDAAVDELEALNSDVDQAAPATAPKARAVADRPRAKAVRLPAGGPSVDEIIASSQRAEAEPELNARQALLDATSASARQLLLAALSEELRSALNRRYRKPALQTTLRLQGAEGLAQVVRPAA